MKRILIVEDEKHLADGLRFNLEADGYEVECAYDGAEALERLSREPFDLIVLDVMMPKRNGFAVAAQLRSQKNYTPILILTALGSSEDALRGFESGADDYLPKPFDLAVFNARVQGLLRRRDWFREEMGGGATPTTDVVGVNGRTIDFKNLELRTAGGTMKLTLMEAKLLRYLLENEGQAVSRKTILEEVWQLRDDTDTRAIDNFIVRLRRYLEDKPEKPMLLQTVRGVGYRFSR